MAERLTTRFHGILVKEADVSKIQVITKLGQLEDIMEEYNIKTISQLQARLSGEDKSHKNAVVWRNKYDELKKQMQNIMDKYGIESVEVIDGILEKYFSDTWITVTPKIMKNWELISDIIASDKLSKDFELGIARDRDTWKRACELMGEELDMYATKEDNTISTAQYFYQQAKKESKNNDTNN